MALDSGDIFSVTFTGVYGDVPLLTARPAARAVVSSHLNGDSPFRKEIQAFLCSADSVGQMVVTWRGLQNVTVGAEDDLESFESEVSSGLTNVTVVGSQAAAVCSGEVVYVTFEQVKLQLTCGSRCDRVCVAGRSGYDFYVWRNVATMHCVSWCSTIKMSLGLLFGRFQAFQRAPSCPLFYAAHFNSRSRR